VAPDRIEPVGDWLVALSDGVIRRAKSAVPLRHDLDGDPAGLDQIEALYAKAGLPPAFRLPDVPGLGAVREELTRRGYGFEQPTLVMTGTVEGLRAVSQGEPCVVDARPDGSWSRVFLGEGFDPVDGAGRVAALSRAKGAAFGAVREGGEAVAVGVVSFAEDWASIHGMRTALARRGEGLAGRVLAGLAEAARARGVRRVFLQVEEGNAPARALYRRAGFETAWRYFYWSRPG
jgi:ribosomal protein S18 acetylase RimI-like enzyme